MGSAPATSPEPRVAADGVTGERAFTARLGRRATPVVRTPFGVSTGRGPGRLAGTFGAFGNRLGLSQTSRWTLDASTDTPAEATGHVRPPISYWPWDVDESTTDAAAPRASAPVVADEPDGFVSSGDARLDALRRLLSKPKKGDAPARRAPQPAGRRSDGQPGGSTPRARPVRRGLPQVLHRRGSQLRRPQPGDIARRLRPAAVDPRAVPVRSAASAMPANLPAAAAQALAAEPAGRTDRTGRAAAAASARSVPDHRPPASEVRRAPAGTQATPKATASASAPGPDHAASDERSAGRATTGTAAATRFQGGPSAPVVERRPVDLAAAARRLPPAPDASVRGGADPDVPSGGSISTTRASAPADTGDRAASGPPRRGGQASTAMPPAAPAQASDPAMPPATTPAGAPTDVVRRAPSTNAQTAAHDHLAARPPAALPGPPSDRSEPRVPDTRDLAADVALARRPERAGHTGRPAEVVPRDPDNTRTAGARGPASNPASTTAAGSPAGPATPRDRSEASSAHPPSARAGDVVRRSPDAGPATPGPSASVTDDAPPRPPVAAATGARSDVVAGASHRPGSSAPSAALGNGQPADPAPRDTTPGRGGRMDDPGPRVSDDAVRRAPATAANRDAARLQTPERGSSQPADLPGGTHVNPEAGRRTGRVADARVAGDGRAAGAGSPRPASPWPLQRRLDGAAPDVELSARTRPPSPLPAGLGADGGATRTVPSADSTARPAPPLAPRLRAADDDVASEPSQVSRYRPTWQGGEPTTHTTLDPSSARPPTRSTPGNSPARERTSPPASAPPALVRRTPIEDAAVRPAPAPARPDDGPGAGSRVTSVPVASAPSVGIPGPGSQVAGASPGSALDPGAAAARALRPSIPGTGAPGLGAPGLGAPGLGSPAAGQPVRGVEAGPAHAPAAQTPAVRRAPSSPGHTAPAGPAPVDAPVTRMPVVAASAFAPADRATADEGGVSVTAPTVLTPSAERSAGAGTRPSLHPAPPAVRRTETDRAADATAAGQGVDLRRAPFADDRSTTDAPVRRFESVLRRAAAAPAPLPVQWRPLASAIAGDRRVRVSTNAASRAALHAAGKRAATTGDVIHLAQPLRGPADAPLLAHELTHVASPSPAPRFFDDDRDSPEERRAEMIADVIRRSPVLPRAAAGATTPDLPIARPRSADRRAPMLRRSTNDHAAPAATPSVTADELVRRLADGNGSGISGTDGAGTIRRSTTGLSPSLARPARLPTAPPAAARRRTTSAGGDATIGSRPAGTVRRSVAGTARSATAGAATAGAADIVRRRQTTGATTTDDNPDTQDPASTGQTHDGRTRGWPLMTNGIDSGTLRDLTDWIVEQVEERVIRELERRGGRYRGEF